MGGRPHLNWQQCWKQGDYQANLEIGTQKYNIDEVECEESGALREVRKYSE